MSPIQRHPFKLLAAVLITGIVILLFQFLIKAGVFKQVKQFHDDLQVETLPTPPGIEDLDYDPASGTLFLSSHDRRNRTSTGAIYAFNPNTNEIRNLTAHLALSEFRPHGISFLAINETKYLFVISHRDTKNVVMKFSFTNDSLHLEKTYSSTDFSSPNDLLAVGLDAFFVTNDHGTTKGWWKMATDYFRLPVGNVVYYDGQRSGVVLKKMAYPNGIAYFNNQIYVASTLGKYIGIYNAVSTNYQLEQVKRIKVPDAPDNLMVAGSRLYFAAHPKLLAFAAHSRDSSQVSPSTVFFLENDLPSLVYAGTDISGSSTALPVPDSSGNIHLYVGSVFESFILKLSPK